MSNSENEFFNTNLPIDHEAVRASIQRLKNFPPEPRVNDVRKVPINYAKNKSPTITPVSSKTRKQVLSSANKTTAASPCLLPESEDSSIKQLLNDVVIVFNGLMEQVSQFKDVLERLENGVSSTVARVITLEEQVAITKRQQESLEKRLVELESENLRINNILNNKRDEFNDSFLISTPATASNSENDVAKLQREVENLQQAKRNNEIILSGNHIKSRIKRELDSNWLSPRALCIDILARIPGLQLLYS